MGLYYDGSNSSITFVPNQLSCCLHEQTQNPKKYLLNINETNIRVLDGENWIIKDEVIMKAKKIISRSGYSTIMDIIELEADFEYFPTKGQAEQIYLSRLYQK